MRFFRLPILICLWSVITYAHEAIRLAPENFPNYRLTLLDGSEIDLPRKPFDTFTVDFVDLHPGANWAHPALFQIRDAEGKLTREISVKFPPPALLSQVKKSPPPNFKLDTWKGRFQVADPKLFHAVLISAKSNPRHWNDFAFLYRTLTQIYGYLPANIHVADTESANSQNDLDGDGKRDIQYLSDRASVQRLFSDLKSTLKTADHLLVVVNGHGDNDGKQSSWIASDGPIAMSDFTQWIQRLPTERIISIFQPCYGGGFVRAATGNFRVALAAATDQEISWSTPDNLFDSFLYWVTAAFAGQTHDGKALGLVPNLSVRSAFAVAVKRDETPESPLMEAGANTYSALNLGLGF